MNSNKTHPASVKQFECIFGTLGCDTHKYLEISAHFQLQGTLLVGLVSYCGPECDGKFNVFSSGPNADFRLSVRKTQAFNFGLAGRQRLCAVACRVWLQTARAYMVAKYINGDTLYTPTHLYCWETDVFMLSGIVLDGKQTTNYILEGPTTTRFRLIGQLSNDLSLLGTFQCIISRKLCVDLNEKFLHVMIQGIRKCTLTSFFKNCLQWRNI